MIVRRLAACAFSGLLMTAGGLVAATAAAAAPTPVPSLPPAAYPPVDQTLTLDPSAPSVGEDTVVTAHGFKPTSAATVTTSAGGILGTGRAPGSVAMAGDAFRVYPATADSLGDVTATVRFDQPGAHTVTVSGVTPAGLTRSISTTVDITAAAAPVTGGGPTARTVPGAADEDSSNLLEYVVAGAGVLVIGGLGFLVLRSRSKRKATGPMRTSMPPTGPAHPVPAGAGVSAYPAGHPSTGLPVPLMAPVAPAPMPAQYPS